MPISSAKRAEDFKRNAITLRSNAVVPSWSALDYLVAQVRMSAIMPTDDILSLPSQSVSLRAKLVILCLRLRLLTTVLAANQTPESCKKVTGGDNGVDVSGIAAAAHERCQSASEWKVARPENLRVELRSRDAMNAESMIRKYSQERQPS